jgi:hypothetical protein
VEVSAARDAEGGWRWQWPTTAPGFQPSRGSGLGLANIRERLRSCTRAVPLTLKARPEGGVAATITLPLEHPGRPRGHHAHRPDRRRRRPAARRAAPHAGQAWPELQIVAECEHGPAAVEAIDTRTRRGLSGHPHARA